jgi:hypothetical protein
MGGQGPNKHREGKADRTKWWDQGKKHVSKSMDCHFWQGLKRLPDILGGEQGAEPSDRTHACGIND